MKGKIISVLICLLVVFGMILAACDNGAMPSGDAIKTDTSPNGSTTKIVIDLITAGEGGGDIGMLVPGLPVPGGDDEGGNHGGEEGED